MVIDGSQLQVFFTDRHRRRLCLSQFEKVTVTVTIRERTSSKEPSLSIMSSSRTNYMAFIIDLPKMFPVLLPRIQYLRPLTWDESGAVSVFEVVPGSVRAPVECPLIVRVVLSTMYCVTMFARQCNAVCESNRYFQCAT